MIIEEISKRRSIRHFQSDVIEPEKLERIWEAAQLAPTARNQQDWCLVVVDDPEVKVRLIDACSPHQPFLKEAPVILVACALNPAYVMRCNQPSYPIDLAIVLDHISLQAVREGLGTCWIGSFYEVPARSVLGIPADVRVVELMALGYPAESPEPRRRKPRNDLIRKNRW
jgi:nitroreductase